MPIKFIALTFSIVFLLSPVVIIAQEKTVSGIDAVAGEWIKSIRDRSREKILLQTDKNIYGSNESIWFRTYIVDSINEKLLLPKSMLFVDLVNEKDQPVAQLFLRADRLQTSGTISLSDTLNSGYYWLRAYTHFQPGTDGQINMSIIPLLIINPLKSLNTIKVPPAVNKNNMQSSSKMVAEIFPEGGAYMSGANNVVVVKVHDAEGNPQAVSGIVKDKQDKEVVSFTTNAYGLGKFMLSPTPHGKYNLYIKNNNGYDSVTALPVVNLHAAQLSVSEQNDQFVKVKVMLEDSLFAPHYTSYLLGVGKDSLCFAGVGQGMYELAIPANVFTAGVAHLLLFNEQGELLSERDIYVQRRNPQVSITTGKVNFGSREKVNMDIRVTDAAGNPMLATISVSVADARLTDPFSPVFTDSLEKDSIQNIDMTMIANPKQLMATKNKLPEPTKTRQIQFNPFVYQGKLVNAKDEALQNYEIYMFSKKNGLTVLQDTTDENGKFSMALPEFDDIVEYNVKIKNLHGSADEYRILQEPKKFPPVATPVSLKRNWVASQQFSSKKVKENHLDTIFAYAGKGVLPAITVKTANKKNGINTSAERSNIITQDMIAEGGVNNIGLALLSIPGVHMSTGYLVIGGPVAFSPSAKDEPMLVMDGSQVFVSDDGSESSPVLAYLKTVNVREIEYVKVLTGTDAAIYGNRGGHGVVEIKTTSKRYTGKAGKEDIKVFLYGYHVARPFTIPNYDNKELINTKYPDLRSTLFWNGDLVTDKSGKATINFYTGDSKAAYLVTVSGITTRGEKVYKTLVINRE